MPEHRIEGVGDVDPEDLLALLDAENVHDVGNDEVGFSCLYVAGHANGDRNPSAHVNRESLLWRCKSCGRAGNLVELVRIGLPTDDGHRVTHPEALAWLREHFGEVVRAPRGGSLAADLEQRLLKARYRPPAKRLPNEAETIGPEGIFTIDWRSSHEAALYMRGRGFAPEVLEDWGLGYDSWTRRVAIPYRDEHGTLVGFKGRSIDSASTVKYLLLGDMEGRQPRYGTGYGFDMFDDSKVVFGLDRVIRFYSTAGVSAELQARVVSATGDRTASTSQLDARSVRPRQQSLAPRSRRRVMMPEGELDVMTCWAAGVPAVAPGTKSVTDQQLWLLRAYLDEIAFCFDAGAGDDAVWGYSDEGRWRPGLVERLSPFFVLLETDEHEGDPASMTVDQVRALYESARHWIRAAVPS